MKHALFLLLVFFLPATPARPDVVYFKNGDQLTGDWVRVQGESLVFRTETIGDVTIPIIKVKSFASSKPAVVLLKGGGTVKGTLALSGMGDWEVKADERATVNPYYTVEAIYPQEVYEPMSPERTRKPWRNWKGTSQFGYSRVQGDSRAGTISAGVNASRRQPDLPGLAERTRSNFFLTMLFANTQSAGGPRTSANSITTGFRQDYLYSTTNFVFALLQYDHIQSQSLNLRQTYGAGLGRNVVRKSWLKVNFLGGTTVVHESFETGLSRNASEGLLENEVHMGMAGRVGLDHRFSFYKSLGDVGAFRVSTTSTLSTRISSRLSLTTGFTDRYLSNPLVGHTKNELVLTTGVAFHF
jgi:hypothetical protein